VLATTYPMLKDRVNGKNVEPPHVEFT
jgi:hypothetical protein